MARVLIQAGHFPNGGGAPGEARWNQALAEELRSLLSAAGVEVWLAGDWFRSTPPALVGERDYDLALFLHYDAAIYGQGRNSGCFADRWRPGGNQNRGPVPEGDAESGQEGTTDAPLDDDQTYAGHLRALRRQRHDETLGGTRGPGGAPRSGVRAGTPVNPTASAEDAFIDIWENTYGGACPIPLRNERRNANTFDYYGYRATTAATPSVLIEHGVGAPTGSGAFPAGDDATFLHDRLKDVARANAQAVASFLGISLASTQGGEPLPTPDPLAGRQTAPTAAEQEALDLLRALGANAESVGRWVGQVNRAAELGRELRDTFELSEERRRAIGAELASWVDAPAPPPPPPPPPPRFRVVVPAADVANVREGAGTEFPVVATLAPGTVVVSDAEAAGGDVPGAGNLWRHVLDPAGWVHASLLAEADGDAPGPDADTGPVTPESRLLSPPRATATAAQQYLLSRPNGTYPPDVVGEIVRLYFEAAVPAGLDPCIVVAQMILETGFLSSFWSQPPRHNPAGIGVTGEAGAGIVFPDWPSAIRAHTGRLLAYALPAGSESPAQRDLIDEALMWRPLPSSLRGLAPRLADLAGRWAADPDYAHKVARHAEAIRTVPL